MSIERVTFDSRAIGKLLKSDEIRDALLKRAAPMATAAGDGFEAKVFMGFDRVSVIVAPTTDAAMRAVLADSTVLTRALDAGRG